MISYLASVMGKRASDSKGTRLLTDLYEAFFLLSAQRLFIANDKRLRPSGVRPLPRFSPVIAVGRGVVAFVFLAIRGNFVPSSSVMARFSRSLSCFKSATSFSMFKLRSFLFPGLTAFCRASIGTSRYRSALSIRNNARLF
jgi:hypothetical protein